jgi:hypothetical protein
VLDVADQQWSATTIWQCLDAKLSAESGLRRYLAQLLDEADAVLRAGGTSPTDFTLHDDRHSFRVAERMVEVVDETVLDALSSIELALLLAAAYGHDIGMTPEAGRVRGVFEYILAGEATTLEAAEIAPLDLWLDEHHAALSRPLNAAAGTVEALRTAALLTTHYARHRHNAWSSEWIRARSGDDPAEYESFTEDLVLLCTSHHEDYEALASPTFDPRLVGGEVAHLRFLAAVLRCADILDVDPERTPDIVFGRRDVSLGSTIYWHRDHEMTITVSAANGTAMVHARPSAARLQKAVEDYAEALDHELRLCRRLDEQTDFRRASWRAEPLPHQWSLPTIAQRDIRERPGTYTYINGAFRADVSRVLELLAGTSLYQSPFAAIRELLQNAFDAVREQILWERLAHGEPSDQGFAERCAQLHSVELSLEVSDDGMVLVCSDTGAGMTRAIIEDALLVTGSGRRRDVLELQRQCQDAGLRFERTGRFGIGVLSYFMLGSRVSVRTRRSVEAGSQESSGWRFEVEGIDGFGELRSDSTPRRGTELRLHLLDGRASPARTYEQIVNYVQTLLVRTPCQVRLSTTLAGHDDVHIPRGWTTSAEQIRDRFIASVGALDLRARSGPMSSHRARREAEWHARQRKRHARASEALCLEEIEGRLDDDLGTYRIHVCWFELDNGEMSLAYLDPDRDQSIDGIRPPGDRLVFVPNANRRLAWHGIAVTSRGTTRGAFVEVDLTSDDAGEIAVSRINARLTLETNAAIAKVRAKALAMRQQRALLNLESRYTAINLALTEAETPEAPTTQWPRLNADPSSGERFTWEPVSYPVIDGGLDVLSTLTSVQQVPRWNGAEVARLDPVRTGDADELRWSGARQRPDRVIGIGTKSVPTLVPLWEKPPGHEPGPGPYPGGPFPPSWGFVAGVHLSSRRPTVDRLNAPLWNMTGPLAWLIDAMTHRRRFRDPSRAELDLDPVRHRDILLADRQIAGTWLSLMLQDQQADLWTWATETQSGLLAQLWKLMFGGGDAVSEVAFVRYTNRTVDLVSPDSWASHDLAEIPDELALRFVIDDPMWRLELG